MTYLEQAAVLMKEAPDEAKKIMYQVIDEGNDRNDLVLMILDLLVEETWAENIAHYLEHFKEV